jgi:hypothetical protein
MSLVAACPNLCALAELWRILVVIREQPTPQQGTGQATAASRGESTHGAAHRQPRAG